MVFEHFSNPDHVVSELQRGTEIVLDFRGVRLAGRQDQRGPFRDTVHRLQQIEDPLLAGEPADEEYVRFPNRELCDALEAISRVILLRVHAEVLPARWPR